MIPAAGEIDINFDSVDCTADGPSVSVVTDSETNLDAVDLADKSRISFPISCKYRYLALNLKNVDKYLSVSIIFRCENGQIREVTVSNKRSIITIEGNHCQAPMQLGPGWQFLNLDLHKILLNAFGVLPNLILQVSVAGSGRVGKIYLQDEEYSDAELPPYLRLIQ